MSNRSDIVVDPDTIPSEVYEWRKEVHAEHFRFTRLCEIIESIMNVEPFPVLSDVDSTLAQLKQRYVQWPVDFEFDKLWYHANIVQQSRREGSNLVNELVIRSPHDGFLYTKNSEVPNPVRTGLKHRDGSDYIQVAPSKSPAFQELRPLMLMACTFFGTDKFSTRILYSSSDNRLDVYFRLTRSNQPDACLAFCFEPGFPSETFGDDMWEDAETAW